MSSVVSLPTIPTISAGPVPITANSEVVRLTHYLQKIAAGFPSPAQDYTEETLDLNEYLVKHKAASFYFTVKGLSMIGAHIDDGDKVLVDRAIDAKHGHIVIAEVNGEYTIKRLYKRRGVIELRPENPNFQPIRFSEGEELIIWGVVTSIIRKLKV